MADLKVWAKARFVLEVEGGRTIEVSVSGRFRWALEQLLNAGDRGCTPIENPAPRWAAYKHGLKEMGVPIETITETHAGEFSGHHARYVLRATLA